MNSVCLCGSGGMYKDCCGPLHNGALAPSPEALMRSRYTAIATNNMAYMDKTASESLRLSEGEASPNSATEWLALHVLEAKPAPWGEKAWVEFVAFYRVGGKVMQLHEKSWFEIEGGRWLYTAGEIRHDVRWGRNDLCWCGSGKKTKKCHEK